MVIITYELKLNKNSTLKINLKKLHVFDFNNLNVIALFFFVFLIL